MPSDKHITKEALPKAAWLALVFFVSAVLPLFLLCVLSAPFRTSLYPSRCIGYLLLSLCVSIAFGLFGALLLQKRYVRPARDLVGKARAFSGRTGETTGAGGSRGLMKELRESFHEMEEAARRSIERANRNRKELERLFEVVPCYISVQDRSFHVIRSNRLFRQAFGEDHRRRCYEIYKNLDSICPNCSVAKTFEDGRIHSNEEEVLTRKGEKVSLIVYSAPITDEEGNIVAVMEMSTNITAVKRLQTELDAQRERLEQLFNMVPCYISIHDRNFNILLTNAMFKQEFGDREGEKCHRVYKGSDRICRDCPVQKTFHDGKVHTSEEVVINKDGEEANVIVYTSPVRDEEGNIYAVMEMSTNITEVKRLQRELVLMGQAVAGMAHTIKNLLMGLEGGIFVVSTALEQKDDNLLMEGWDMVHRNVGKVSHMVKDLLYCAKDREHHFRRADPAAIAREVYELFEEKAKKDEIELRLEVEDTLPEAELDPDAVHNLLSNLISNAIDACKFDFSKQDHWICLRASQQVPDRLVYEVADNGKGIPAEWSDKVFDNFFSTKGDKGTGLGLLVARKVVQEHHGNISFTSEPNQGTTFRVALPTRQPDPTPQTDRHSEEPIPPATPPGESDAGASR